MNNPSAISVIRQRTISGLQPGDRFTIRRVFHQSDVDAFAAVSRDDNPVHTDEDFVRAKGFAGRICHGLLVASMITEIGGQIGWLASGLSFRFIKPVYIGDTVECRFILQRLDENRRASAQAEYINQHGQTVMTAELTGILPDETEKQIMAGRGR
jgi:3-hydroxybutyryl-CoA dehydratase